jgi:hypothetical protein
MDNIGVRNRRVADRGWNLVRTAVAGLLLTASALKCWQLATEPVIGTSLLDSRWLLMAMVEFELFFGIWLLANIWARPTWTAALACFALFTCVSLCKAISGQATCGCFGRVPVNPWYTGALDMSVVMLLLRWRPRCSFFSVGRAVSALLAWLSMGLPAAFAMVSYSPAILSDAGEVRGNGKVVVLEPENWRGQAFPLLPYIADDKGMLQLQAGKRPLRERLVEGNWIVVLYHHDCPKCRRVVRNLSHGASTARIDARVVLIEMPPYGDQGEGLTPSSPGMERIIGRLNDGNEWFATTPVVIRLKGGIVAECSSY